MEQRCCKAGHPLQTTNLSEQEIMERHRIMQKLLEDDQGLIFRKITNVLCNSLRKLRERCKMGESTPQQIWDGLAKAFADGIPTQFFEDFTYFSESGAGAHLTANELVLIQILEEAMAIKIRDLRDNFAQIINNNNELRETVERLNMEQLRISEGLLPLVEKVEGQVKFDMTDTSSTRMDSKFAKAGGRDSNEERELTEKLVDCIISMIQKAIEWSAENHRGWKTRDMKLRQEMAGFHYNLTQAKQLFTKLKGMPNVLGRIYEKLMRKPVESPAKQPAIATCSNNSRYNLEKKKPEIQGPFRMERVAGWDCSKLKGNARINVPKSVQTDVDSDDSMDKTGFEKMGETRVKSKLEQNRHCNQTGCVLPPAHYRDWKRDGWRCVCGQKFRCLNTMERHLVVQRQAQTLTCDVCKFATNRYCQLDKHKKECHENNANNRQQASSRRVYQCMFGCEAVLKSKRELIEHQRTTDRQCKNRNASKVAVKYLPQSRKGFEEALKRSFDSQLIEEKQVDTIMHVADMDANRLEAVFQMQVHGTIIKAVENVRIRLTRNMLPYASN